MKRAIIVSAGTLAGLAAVLGLNPDDPTADVPASAASPSTDAGSTASGSSGSSGSSSTPSGTFTGTEVQVRSFGVIQVEVTTRDGRITAITALQEPDWDGQSQMISSYSIPQLIGQAVDAQSADIAGISGATFTSVGFSQSLQAALAKAGLG